MSCEVFQARLVSGERPVEDGALAAHVGSCLRCFRTAADMKDVPRLAVLLREGNREGNNVDGETHYDPGARFWETFPKQVASAWVSSRRRARRSLWHRVSLWMRRPLPAALTGAACAVGLAVLVLRPTPGPVTGARVLGGGAEPGLSELGPETGEGAGDEAVGELDVEALATLRDQLDRALRPDEAAATPAEPPGDPANVAEDLEMLDETGLLALRENLGPRI